MNLNDARQRIPELAGLSDASAIDVIHQVYYPGMDKMELSKRLGYEPPPAPTESAGVFRTLGDLGIKGAQGVVDLGASVVGMGNMLSGGLVGQGMDAIGYDPKRTNASMGEYLSTAQKAADQRVQDAQGFWGTLGQAVTEPRFIAGSVAQSVPGMLGIGAMQSAAAGVIAGRAALATAEGAAAAAGKTGATAMQAALATRAGQSAAQTAVDAAGSKLMAIGAASEGAQSMGSIAQDAQQSGRSWSQYAPGALAAGLGTGAIAFGAGKLMGDAGTEVFTGAHTKLGNSLPVRMAKSGFSEGVLEEMPQSAQERYFTNVAMGEADPMKGVGEDAATGLLTGGAMGIGMGGMHGQQARAPTPAVPPQPEGPMARAVRAGGQVVQVPAVVPSAAVAQSEIARMNAQAAQAAAQATELARQADEQARFDALVAQDQVASQAPSEPEGTGDPLKNAHDLSNPEAVQVSAVPAVNVDAGPNVGADSASPVLQPKEIPNGPEATQTVQAETQANAQAAALTASPAGAAAPDPVLTRAKEIDSGPAVVLQNRDRSSAASIAQMNEIAARPDYLRAGQSSVMDSGAPVVFGDLPPSALVGKSQEIADGKGQRTPIQYAVVDATDLIASHSADGTTVDAYAAGAPGKLRAVAGNGRTAGIIEAYQRGTAEQYRQDLSNDASALGFDPTGLAAMKAPVLVRVMDAKDVTADIGDRSNISNTARLSSVEQASTDARRLNLESLEFHEDGNPTQAAVTQFVRAMPTSEQTELIAPDGTPTKQAVDRLMAAAFKQAYGSDELVGLYAQAQDSEARTILSGLADAAGLMSALKDSGEFDIRGAVTEAAGFAVNARRLGHKLADMLKTPDMLMSDEARVVAQFMADNVRSAKKISEGLRNVAEYAAEQAQIERNNKTQGGMFGETPTASRTDILRKLNGNKLIVPQARAEENHLQQPRGTPEVERVAQQAPPAGPEAESVAASVAVEPAAAPASIPAAAPAATPTVASAEPAVEAPALTSYTNADALAREQHLADTARLDRQEQVQREATGQTLTSETPVETRQDSTGEMFAEEKTQAQVEAAQEELAKKNAGKPKAVDPNQNSMFDDLPPEPDAIAAAPVRAQPVFKPVGESANTGNAGAELSYNKRNRIKNGIAWADIADKDVALRVKETTKQNVHPKPDYQALVDAGMQPLIAHIVKQAYDALAVAPKTRMAPTDAQLQSYIAGVQRYMAGVMAWAGDPKLTRAWIGRMAQHSGKMAGAATGSPISLSDLAGAQEKSLLTIVYPEGWRAHESEIRLIGSNKALSALQPGVDEAIAALKDIDKGWPQKQEAWQRQGYTVVNGKERQFILLDKRNRSVGVHETLESAQEQARELTRRDAKSSTISDKGISVESAQRQGVEHRIESEDISSDKLKDTFGFKGVNFGTWMLGESPAKVAERQLHLNHAFDSFMDLASVLGVPPKALSLDGLLGLAIGAQGSGSAAAHFVPGVNEINLTRTSGAGSLAHEWGHALDHYFARQADLTRQTTAFLTEHLQNVDADGYTKRAGQKVKAFGEGIRPEIVAAFGEIVKAMNERAMTQAEYDADRQASLNKTKGYVEGWLKSIRKDFERLTSAGPIKINSAGRVVDVSGAEIQSRFDSLANQVRALDLGEAKVLVGSSLALSEPVAAMRDHYKQLTDRTYSIDQIRGLQSNVDALKYKTDALAASDSHVPNRQVPTIFAKAAARIDQDKGGKPYWSTNLEKFARSFDAFVSDKLEAEAAKNTYLSHAGREGDTVPSGTEREAINAGFQKLVDTLETKETDSGVAMFSRDSTAAWPDGFENLFAHTTISKVTKHPDFAAAKRGDVSAAQRLVAELTKPDRLQALATKYPQAIVVGVMEREPQGNNQIPSALAAALVRHGLSADLDIVSVSKVSHKDKDGVTRLLTRKAFDGKVLQGASYIIADDVVTQGGTIHELRHFIENNGGHVLATTSLAFSAGSNIIAIKPETISALQKKFNRAQLERILSDQNIAGSIEALTESEGRAVLRFRTLESLGDRIAAARAQVDNASNVQGLRTQAGQPLRSIVLGGPGAALPVSPSTVPALQAAIKEFVGASLGGGLGRIVATTATEIKSTWEPLIGKDVNVAPDSQAGRAQGFFDPASKTVFLIADQIEAGTEQAVLAHELMHKHGQAVLGEAGWNQLHGVIDSWKQAEPGSNERGVYDYASARVNAAGIDLSTQELFPYAVEGALKLGIKPNAFAKAGTVAKWLAQVKLALKTVWDKLTRKPDLFKAQDLVNLAFGIAQRENHAVETFNDGKSSVLSKNGKFQAWPKFNSWTRAEYKDVVSLLPAAYRSDPHRSEPLSPQDWDRHTDAAVPEIDALNAKVGEGTFRIDGLGNILADARKNDASIFADEVIAIADKHGLGIYLTGVSTPSISRLQSAGFVSELGLGAMLQRASGSNQPARPHPDNIYSQPSPGTVMSYKPRGFASVLFSRAGSDSPLVQRATDVLNETFSHPGKLSWWDKTVGSPYHLAQRYPAFKPVFTSAQNFINDVSFYATEAADMAPKILPKLQSWSDLLKTPISAADNKAISVPILEGTLSWTRDGTGKPMRIAEDDEETTPGIVWSDAELHSMFHLTPQRIGLYREFRSSVDKSLDNMAKADLLRIGGRDVADLKDQVMAAKDVIEAATLLHQYLHRQKDLMPERSDVLIDTARGLVGRANRIERLKQLGYAPLSRFGRYSVDVVVGDERQYFGLFETGRAANQMATRLKAEFGARNVAQGTLSEKEFEMFQGITPESLELFGNMLGLDSVGDQAQDKVFQTYLKRTKSNRSAMKRLIHRKGTAGYSDDMGRVLAAFVYSNARQTSAALHMGELGAAVNDIPKSQGQLKDSAIELATYIKQPREEAQALRGMLFTQYLGGSVASAFVNITQPFAVSIPYLSQFGGAAKAGSFLIVAMKDMSTGRELEVSLAKALKVAEEQGVVAPQEVHQLMAQARGASTLRIGDGTRLGEAMTGVANNFSKLMLGWGKMFGMAEQINRRSTFIAAYRLAQDRKIANPAGFATQAVNETQFINNKANKANWARGPVGATLMTFKSYSVNYLELLHRMATQGGPEGMKAALLMLGTLMLMAGSSGLPFVDDAEDLVDFLGQRLGYNFSSKKTKQEFLENLFGRAGAQFVDKGLTGLPGSPIDVSGRLSMANLIPGTGLLLKKADHTRDVAELVGPVGDLAARAFQAGDQALSGDLGKAAVTLAPKAVGNLAKGVDMMNTDMYRDDKGYKVIETTPTEAAMKMLGFQPATVAEVQQANYLHQRSKDFYNQHAQDIRARWAKGIFENSPAQVESARLLLDQWNVQNPDQRIGVNMQSVVRRVKEMRKSKDQRIADTAPKVMRASMRREVEGMREDLR